MVRWPWVWGWSSGVACGRIKSRLDEHMNSENFGISVEWPILCDFYMFMC